MSKTWVFSEPHLICKKRPFYDVTSLILDVMAEPGHWQD